MYNNPAAIVFMWSLDKLLKQYMGINLVYKYAIVHTDCVWGSTVRQVTEENPPQKKRHKESKATASPLLFVFTVKIPINPPAHKL